MKTILKFTLAMLIMGITNQGFSQNVSEQTVTSDHEVNVRPIRIGFKLGFPNLIGGNLEYVLPLLNNKIAVSADYSRFKSSNIIKALGVEDTDDVDMSVSFLEGGLNYYIFKPGDGLYAGVSYNRLKFDGTIFDFFESQTEEGKYGDGIVDFTNSSFNLKIGIKMGGLFYFRPEVGYAFTAFPTEIPVEVRFEDGTTEQQTYDTYTTDIIHNGLIFNIGLGFAF
ncbi:hypothetical protein [Gramella sp. AN32]|uniref:Outer membrane protein beta-barrel domain-containing protein n=1 Tax=Christiangramia antarctica TaxID=2058158 RepID=A0ABW5XAR7_9FLAO|nr:hypothetical protein [Gramella sp. AN32]MCM4157343.1 hypothetical protein [Gramella sp. AN32]